MCYYLLLPSVISAIYYLVVSSANCSAPQVGFAWGCVLVEAALVAVTCVAAWARVRGSTLGWRLHQDKMYQEI